MCVASSRETLKVEKREDLVEYVQKQGRVTSTALIILIASIGGIFVDGYDTGAVSFGLSTIIQLFHLTPLETSLVGSFVALGSIIGGFFASRVLDRLGRRIWFIATLIIFIVGAIVSALAVNGYMIFAGRLILGFGIGMDYAVAFSYIPEISNARTKGRNANLQQFAFFGGLITAGLIGLATYRSGFTADYWRWILGFGAVFAAVFISMRQIFIIETPMWAALNRPIEEVKEIFEKTYNVTIEIPKDAIEHINTRKSESQYHLIELFSKRFRRLTVATIALSIFQGFEYYGVIFYLPLIVSYLYPKGGITDSLIGADTYYVVGFLGGGLMAFYTHKVGIKNLIVMGASIVFASALLIGTLGPILGLTFVAIMLGFYVYGHATGPGPNFMTLASMAYPTYIRGRATGFTYAMRSVGAFFGYFTMPLLKPLLGLDHAILVVSIFPLLVVISALMIKQEPLRVNVEEQNPVSVEEQNKNLRNG